ncbi:helix-turn-helix domain-containing protein [Catenuloplanes japonicus]|uniref:helix-turn-helix domain-containing protein n=1 Tax=Catenuloplanes japonicus TaxID=33876 RepID=UPI000526F8A5|nr:AraC family transcriptional regulator [Catenuloplanes japonicus]
MGYREHAPLLPALARWVSCTWVRVAGADPTLVTPDGCVDLYRAGGRLVVAGPDTAARLVTLPPGTEVAGVRLRPGAAPLLLGDVPAGEVRDAQPELDRLWPAAVVATLRRATTGEGPDATTATSEDRDATAVLERALAARLRSFVPDRAVLHAVEALDTPRPPALAALARDLGLSERQLRRRVTDAVGYGPRTLHGVLRFRRATAAARDGVPWPDAAARTGYSDQPHLVREVRRWSGRTPTALVSPRPLVGPRP